VALDERGTPLTTVALAEKLKAWQLENDDVALVIGGPDGLDPAFRQAAHERIRLSDLTLPHAMVRVLLAERSSTAPGRSTPHTRTTVSEFIYLASQSPRRRQLLEQLGVRHELLLPDAGRGQRSAGGGAAGRSARAYVRRVTGLKLDAAWRA
jgi:hypothetical protein